MKAVTSRLSLAQCVKAVIQNNVAMRVHLSYNPNPAGKLNCFGKNCILFQKERYKENKYWHNIQSKQYWKEIMSLLDGIITVQMFRMVVIQR